jgi:pimeloyl-ACP methyl ester carboxylesterase
LRAGKRILWVVVVLLVVVGVGFWAWPVAFFDQWIYLRDWLGGVRNAEVEVGGHRVHYEIEGPADGPVVVLVHGLGGRAEDWRDLAPYLAKAGFRVYMPDLIGYGRSDKPKDFSYSVHDEAGVVVGFMNALRLKQVDLGGWSMGGAIVQHVAADHPGRIEKLMLFDSAGLYVLPAWDVKLFTPKTPAQLSDLEALLIPNPPHLWGFIGNDILRMSERRAWIIHKAMASMMTGQDATDKLLPLLKMPVLLVWGAEDRIVPLTQGEETHKLVPQSQMEVVPGCGHLAPGLCAAQMAPTVVSFLRQ